MATQGVVQLTSALNHSFMMMGPIHQVAVRYRTRLSSLLYTPEKDITVSGRVSSVTRPPFRCMYGSGDYAMGFNIVDETGLRKVFLFAQEENDLPHLVRGSEIEIHGAKYSLDSRFGYEIRASPHQGGSWNFWTPRS